MLGREIQNSMLTNIWLECPCDADTTIVKLALDYSKYTCYYTRR